MSYLRVAVRAAIALATIAAPAAPAALLPPCPPTKSAGGPAVPATPATVAAPTANEPVHVLADRYTAYGQDRIVLEGHVTIVRGNQRVHADRVEFDRHANTLNAEGHVRLETTRGDIFRSPTAFLHLDDDTGYTGEGEYYIEINHGRGHAHKVIFEGKGRLRLRAVQFSTCPTGKRDWYLSFGELELNQNTDTGIAHNAVLHVKGVPMMYLPYMSFPLSARRQSGFLIPDLGSSDSVGSYLALPYYLNLAPNYDATLTPRWMSRRGLQLQTEFRYLTPDMQGVAEVDALPNDAVTNTGRYSAHITHQQQFNSHLGLDADVNWVSDIDYVNDFSNNLALTSASFLPQNLTLNYRNGDWKMAALLSRYQPVDRNILTSNYPYERLPQLTVDMQPTEVDGRLNYDLTGSATVFRHEDASKPTGERLTLNPAVSLPLRRDFGFIVPRVSLDHSSYYQQSNGANGGFTVPVASVDSGLYFERKVGNGDKWTQTLEPRLFYLYAPYVDQTTLPVYDTSIPLFTFDSLFRENRFVGGDRMGDTNQITAAVTTRLIDKATGSEAVTASLGQIYYLADRRVVLPGASPDIAAQSDIAGELTAWLGRHWFWRGSLLWDPSRTVAAAHSEYLQYHPGKDRIFTLAYGYQQGIQEVADASAEWPLGHTWTVFGHSQYSLRDKRNLDTSLGFEYHSCCWSLRMVGSRRVDQSAQETSAIAIQMVFRGLGGVESGTLPQSPLSESVFP